MKKVEVLQILNSIKDRAVLKQDIMALEIAKKSLISEYKYKFLTSVCSAVAAVIVFGSLVAMSYFIYK